MSKTFRYLEGDELGNLSLWWFDSAGALRDLSTASAFSVRLGRPGEPAVFTKTSGVTGAAGSGAEPDGTPNLTINWTSADLGAVTVPSPQLSVRYRLFITATISGEQVSYPAELWVQIDKATT